MTRRRKITLWLVWTLPSAVFLMITCNVYSAYRIAPPTRLEEPERTAVIAHVRAALEGKEAPAAASVPVLEQPISATVWAGGKTILRVDHHGDGDSQSAVAQLAAKVRAHPGVNQLTPADRVKARIQIDVVTGRAPLGRNHWLFDIVGVPGVGDMLAINPGVEGIGVEIDGKTTVVLPHELVAAKLLAAKKPSDALADFAMGVDLDKIRTLVAQRANVKTGVSPDQLFRFRTDTFVERPADDRTGTLQLYRGNTAPPKLTAKVLREYALAGGKYLAAHLAPTPSTGPLAPKGRYIYEHDLATGVQTDPRGPSYSMPRHAGTTYFLAELYRITKDPDLKEPIERAFEHLVMLMSNGKCSGKLPDGTDIDCVMDKSERIASLGSTALAVVALAEYQRATGDKRYLALATKLGSFLLWMQRPDGSFRHRYNPATRQADDVAQDLYYSGEASLALARMYVVTKDERYIKAAEKGLDWLVGWYDFFMSGFFYGEEHWTCIASEAAWPSVQKPAYRDFCHGYGKFLRDQQTSLGEHPDEDDYAGAYGFTPFLAPHNTPAGSRTEAMISSYLLGRHHGTPDPAVREQIRAALQYVLGQQITSLNDFAVVGPGAGGMPGSPIDRNVRIDYVQHVCSAFIRASEWIDDE